MSGVVLDSSRLTDVTFDGCKVDTASLRNLETTRVAWRDVVLVDADFTGSRLRGSVFGGCDLRGARVTDVDARGASFVRSDLAGVRGAESLRGITIGESQVGDLVGALFEALSITVTDVADAPRGGAESSS
jgi:uncharacterized protein YjbI with pentapeptide repeats